jgi:WD40 repeat protein
MSTSFSRLRGTSTDFGDSEDLHWQHPLANGAHVRCVGNSIILKMPKRTVSAYASNEDNLSAKCIFILSNGNLVTVSSQPIISIRYLDNNCYKVQRSLVGHEGTIQCVQELYQDHLVSCSHKGDMGEIKIWSLKTGMCMRTLQQQNTSVHCFSSNADVSMLACGAADGEMQVWDLQTTSQVNGHQYELEVTCLKILPNNLLAVGLKNGMLTNGSIRGYTINIYNLKDNSDNINLSEHTSRIQCITIFNGDMISCTANEVKIWDLNSFTCRSTIAGNYEEGEKLYMFHYADTVRIVKQKYEIITTISLEEFIKEWDVKIAQEKATLENANKGWISSLIFGWY